jgi:hypothetical protein
MQDGGQSVDFEGIVASEQFGLLDRGFTRLPGAPIITGTEYNFHRSGVHIGCQGNERELAQNVTFLGRDEVYR